MALRRNPVRSQRFSRYKDSGECGKNHWFPDLQPLCHVHKQIAVLNKESYAASIFAQADDLLVFSLFANKGKKRRHHQIKRPESALPLTTSASEGSQTPLSNEGGRRAATICKPLVSGGESSWEGVTSTVSRLQEELSEFHSEHEQQQWAACLKQFVNSTGHQEAQLVSESNKSLLYRYSLIYASASVVQVGKVTYTGQEASFGLKAACDIEAGTYIMETCSSMSLDTVHSSGPSIIEAAARQLGPQGPRLILGPFQFVNHDCDPNGQVS